MTIWHVLLYAGAAVLALRSFIQLVTNYRHEFEHTTVASHLKKLKEELESDGPAEQAASPEEAVAADSQGNVLRAAS